METIRYVEDDWSLIDGLEYTLEASGYSADNARTVKQALALFNSSIANLIICSCWMLPCRMAADLKSVKKCEKALPFRLYF
ncbi:hypothetical protein [uncultured Oscillibacter sp.]|uniref:hypothetical protein n=1 Tax=uncultured Oscillibacter sp. TaxID=876091 RepID=UPI0025E982C7|nr:hypothetical protein [uncultured Oscillibacter sp.]